jgi:hypothetical protein
MKNTKKYTFTKETKEFNSRTLRRIRAARNFGNVKKGELGGFIETEANLSHDGNCWVFDNARVSGNAYVYGNARVYEDAWVCGNAQVCGYAQVFGDARVYENAWICGYARVSGDAQVSGNAWVYRDAQVSGNAYVSGDQELTSGYHNGSEPIKAVEELSENTELIQLRQENKELKEKLNRFLAVADSIAH